MPRSGEDRWVPRENDYGLYGGLVPLVGEQSAEEIFLAEGSGREARQEESRPVTLMAAMGDVVQPLVGDLLDVFSACVVKPR